MSYFLPERIMILMTFYFLLSTPQDSRNASFENLNLEKGILEINPQENGSTNESNMSKFLNIFYFGNWKGFIKDFEYLSQGIGLFAISILQNCTKEELNNCTNFIAYIIFYNIEIKDNNAVFIIPFELENVEFNFSYMSFLTDCSKILHIHYICLKLIIYFKNFCKNVKLILIFG